MTDKQAKSVREDTDRQRKRILITKISLTVSAILLIVSCIVSATSTVAWITHTTPDTVNIFQVGELKLKLSHKVENEDGTSEYQTVTPSVRVFADDALFEPGYVEVVYLRIDNIGEVDFDYRLSVTVDDVVYGTNEKGESIYLPDYLKFGAVWGNTEAELTRQLSMETATQSLGTYTEISSLEAPPGNSYEYVALIVYMPTEVGNEANYRGATVPTVYLGVTVNASQKGTLQ